MTKITIKPLKSFAISDICKSSQKMLLANKFLFTVILLKMHSFIHMYVCTCARIGFLVNANYSIKAWLHTRMICMNLPSYTKFTSSRVNASGVFTESDTVGVLSSKHLSNMSSVVT